MCIQLIYVYATGYRFFSIWKKNTALKHRHFTFSQKGASQCRSWQVFHSLRRRGIYQKLVQTNLGCQSYNCRIIWTRTGLEDSSYSKILTPQHQLFSVAVYFRIPPHTPTPLPVQRICSSKRIFLGDLPNKSTQPQ